MWYIRPDERKLNVQQATANGSFLWNFSDYRFRFGRKYYSVEFLHVHLLKSSHVCIFMCIPRASFEYFSYPIAIKSIDEYQSHYINQELIRKQSPAK